MDLRNIIQGYLESDERCQSFTTASLISANQSSKKILGLVYKNADFGLLIFKHTDTISSSASLQVDRVLPFDGKYSITECDDEILELSSQTGDKLRFQFTHHAFLGATFFFQDLKNAISGAQQSLIDMDSSFDWLNKYQTKNTLQPSQADQTQAVNTSVLSEFDPWTELLPPPSVKPAQELANQTTQTSKAESTDNSPLGPIVFDMSHYGPPSPATPSITTADDHLTSTLIDVPESCPTLRPQKKPPTFVARESYIKIQLEAREEEFTHRENFRIFIGTWNVNGQSPSESLKPWLCYIQGSAPDVIAVGFQELDLSAETLILKSDSGKEEEWLQHVEKGLPSTATEQYVKVQSIRLVGIMLAVYVKVKHQSYLTEIDAADAATGIMGMFGNKGGVAVRFMLHNTSLCFINSHLAAHTEEYEKRNQDYRDILNKLAFTKSDNFPYGVESHDIVFWLGDLNYRLSGLDTEKVKEMAAKKQHEQLYEYDQLKFQKSIGRCFEGFLEGPLLFSPTYKYDTGTDIWDSSEKCRCPAWCDRILWRHGINDKVKQLHYTSHPKLKLSDHKPVSSLFDVGIKVVNKVKQRDVMEGIVRQVDKLENEFLPQVEINKREFEFGEVHFLEKKSSYFMIENTGQVPVMFSFVPKLDEQKVCKDWLTIKPQSGVIMPDGKRQVELMLCVDKKTAASLSRKEESLEDILVLHLEGGRDLFLPVSGKYVSSIFGTSLECLCRGYGPIRDVPVATLIDLGFDYESPICVEKAPTLESIAEEPQASSPTREPLEIPKELWLLGDHLYKNAMRREDIFRQSGLESELLQIRDYLDTGQRGNLPGCNDSVAEALLMFLESLPEPVIPYSFYQKCMDCSNSYILCRQVICQIPEFHRNVFKYITGFLQELLFYSADNKLDAKMLATIFGGIILRSPSSFQNSTSKRGSSQVAQKKARFLWQFLINDFE